MLKSITTNEVRKHTIGMFIVGAIVWILYLLYANLLTLHFGINHFISEGTGIPLSWIVNYAINTKFNFDLPFTWKRFGSFCGISLFGWCFYLLSTYLTDNVWHLWTLIGTIVGVFVKTFFNVVLQQAITFGKFGEKKQAKTVYEAKEPDYDWNGYYSGNPLQKWWKRSIIDSTRDMITSNAILDVGCGSSPLLSLLKYNDKTGIDINSSKIEFMKEKDKSSKYLVYDGKELPFKSNMFNTVICNEVIEHHPNPNFLINELSRVATINGTIIVSTPDFGSIKWNIIEILYGLIMKSGYELEHGSKFTKTGLDCLCKAYGLEPIEHKMIAGCDMVCKYRKV